MSKAWDALDQTDREQLIGYVLGEHRDELGILYAIASDHEDREVRTAAKVAEAALQRCCALLARRYEGDLAHAMETRRGEAAVSMLAKVLGLVGLPRPTYDAEWARDVAIAEYIRSLRKDIEAKTPRWHYDSPPGAEYIGRDRTMDTWYRSADGFVASVHEDGTVATYTEASVRRLHDGPHHSAFAGLVAIIDAHLATRAVEPEYRTEYKCEWLPAEGPRWQYKSATDKYIGQADHEDLYWQPDIDRVGCVWSDGLTHGGYMRDTLNGSTSPRLVRVRAMLDAHLARGSR